MIDCGAPTSIASGGYSLSDGTVFGDRVTYFCDTGYSLLGDPDRQCIAIGIWGDGSVPSCISKSIIC